MASSLVLSCALLAICTSGALAAVGRMHVTGDVKWTTMNDEDGEPRLAILEGPLPKAEIVLRDNVTFILYTRENDARNGTRVFNDDVDSLVEFDSARDTKIMIHGFWGGLSSKVIQATRRGWINNGDDYNMIGVDWGVLCPSPFYNAAKINSLLVGPYVAELIDFLVANKGARLSQFQLIGHSLGGQVIGIAGGNVTGGRVARISGMDPALPLFDVETDINRLDPSDADLVDVIHSDGGALGYLTPVGHVDFYPNGGIHPQPGCETDLTGQCSHDRCHEWYADSIVNRDRYPARLCATYQDAVAGNCAAEFTGLMGDAIGDTPHGIYYLQADPVKPPVA